MITECNNHVLIAYEGVNHGHVEVFRFIMVGSSQECIDWLKIMSSSLVRRGRIPSFTMLLKALKLKAPRLQRFLPQKLGLFKEARFLALFYIFQKKKIKTEIKL